MQISYHNSWSLTEILVNEGDFIDDLMSSASWLKIITKLMGRAVGNGVNFQKSIYSCFAHIYAKKEGFPTSGGLCENEKPCRQKNGPLWRYAKLPSYFILNLELSFHLDAHYILIRKSFCKFNYPSGHHPSIFRLVSPSTHQSAISVSVYYSFNLFQNSFRSPT